MIQFGEVLRLGRIGKEDTVSVFRWDMGAEILKVLKPDCLSYSGKRSSSTKCKVGGSWLGGLRSAYNGKGVDKINWRSPS